MKITPIALSIIFFSCNTLPTNKHNSSLFNNGWIIRDSSVLTHTYRPDGLLDETHKTEYHFLKGALVFTYAEVIIRKYDERKNLISEQTFSANKHKLTDEKIMEYDNNNNLISEIEEDRGVIFSILKNTYNIKNQKIKEIEINRNFHDEKDWTIDSMVEYSTGQKVRLAPSYDTFTSDYSYNKKGILIEPVSNGSDTSFVDYIKEDSIEKGDTLIKYTKTESSKDTSWSVGGLKIKSVHYNKKFQDNEMKFTRYNEKRDIIEEVTYQQILSPAIRSLQ